MILKIIALTTLFYQYNTQKLEIKNLQEDPILIIKSGQCRIQTGNIKIIHPINLTNIEITVETINKIITNKLYDKLELDKIVKQKSNRLYSNLRQIKPKQIKRFKRWDSLGYGWKWIAGSPDAEDLRIINTTMNELINTNNQQIQINQRIDRRIQIITDTVNRAVTNSTISNKIVLTEIEMLATIISIDSVNTILEDIQDAVIRTKVGLPSGKVLTINEIMMIKDLLVNQGINITIPDEALKYVTPKIAVNGETLLYILQIPKLEKENSQIIMIVPLVINDTIIKDHPQYLLKSKQKLYSTLDHKSFVQRNSEIKEFQDDCIKPLIMGTKSNCNVISETETKLQFISENKLIINNAKNEKLSSDCGPNNRTLSGNLIVTFENCTIAIKNREFQSYDITSDVQETQGALYNLQATRQLVKTLDINAINQENIQNRKQLKNVYLEQISHKNWIWTLSGGVSLSSITIIALIIYIALRNYQTAKVKITKSTISEPRETSQIQQLSNLLKEASSKLMDGDAHFSPPGGVMVPHNKPSDNIPTQKV